MQEFAQLLAAGDDAFLGFEQVPDQRRFEHRIGGIKRGRRIDVLGAQRLIP
jgi:hypothetical protein